MAAQLSGDTGLHGATTRTHRFHFSSTYLYPYFSLVFLSHLSGFSERCLFFRTLVTTQPLARGSLLAHISSPWTHTAGFPATAGTFAAFLRAQREITRETAAMQPQTACDQKDVFIEIPYHSILSSSPSTTNPTPLRRPPPLFPSLALSRFTKRRYVFLTKFMPSRSSTTSLSQHAINERFSRWPDLLNIEHFFTCLRRKDTWAWRGPMKRNVILRLFTIVMSFFLRARSCCAASR